MAEQFINDDFILYSETARELYHSTAKQLGIIDFHNNLNTREIYEDKKFEDISQLWLGGDHYKWRMRLWKRFYIRRFYL